MFGLNLWVRVYGNWDCRREREREIERERERERERGFNIDN